MSSSISISAKTVIGAGEASILVEARAGTVRLKQRGRPDLFVPYELIPELSRALTQLSANAERARA